MKKIYLFLLLFFAIQSDYCQCMLYPVSLQSRINNSSLIIHGSVISSKSFWNAAHNNIFTSNLVRVSQVLKGNLTASFIEIITQGGVVDLDMQTFEPSLQLSSQEEGVFMLIPSDQISQYGNAVYYSPADQQGFIKFNILENTAQDPFKIYSSINGELKDLLQSELNKPISPLRIAVNEGGGKFIPININALPPAISSFAPANITAGTASQLTITGSGFGLTQGASVVRFPNADAAAGYITPHATQYLSWSDLQIIVEIPSRTSGSGSAGSGNFQVAVAGNTVTSATPLTIPSCHLNVLFSNTVTPSTQIFNTRHHSTNGSGGMNWRLHTAFDASVAPKTDWQTALGTWRCATKINWQIGTTVSTNTVDGDGINVVGFENAISMTPPMGAGVLAVTSSWFQGCVSGTNIAWYVAEHDMVFDANPPSPWNYGPGVVAGTFDFESVALHELGHAHQLGHIILVPDVMHFSIGTGVLHNTLTPATNSLGAIAVMNRNLSGPVCGNVIMTALTNGNCALAAPVASFNVSSTVCVGQVVPLNDISTNNPNVWSWNMPTGAPASSTLQNTTTTYATPGVKSITLVATNGTGSTSIVKTLTVIASPTLTVSSASICAGTTATLTANGSGTSYVWNPGGLTGTIQTLSPGATQVYTVTASIGACSANSTGTIVVTNTPNVSVNSGTICPGGSIVLTAGGAGSFTWNPGGATGPSQTYSPAVTTIYTLTGANGNCTSNVTATITVSNTLNIGVAASNTFLCVGQSATLTANGATNYTYNPGGINANPATVSPITTTNYTVLGTSSGCSGSAIITVSVDVCSGISNLNSDQKFVLYPNPTQGIITINFSSAYSGKITVYNSLGQLLINKNLFGVETYSLNLSDVAKGIYILKISTENMSNGFIKVVKD